MSINRRTFLLSSVAAAAAGYLYARRGTGRAPETVAQSSESVLSAAHRGAAGRGAASPEVVHAGGKVITVKAGDSIQAAIAAAQPGDTGRPSTSHPENTNHTSQSETDPYPKPTGMQNRG